MRIFHYHVDAGHGWLVVSGADLVAVGRRPWDFSKYSYVNPRRPLFALEEDCDMPLFLSSCDAAGWKYRVVEVPCAGTNSGIRSWLRNTGSK